MYKAVIEELHCIHVRVHVLDFSVLYFVHEQGLVYSAG